MKPPPKNIVVQTFGMPVRDSMMSYLSQNHKSAWFRESHNEGGHTFNIQTSPVIGRNLHALSIGWRAGRSQAKRPKGKTSPKREVI